MLHWRRVASDGCLLRSSGIAADGWEALVSNRLRATAVGPNLKGRVIGTAAQRVDLRFGNKWEQIWGCVCSTLVFQV